MDDLANQIAAAVQQSVAADADITAEWQDLTTNGAPLAPKDVPDSVGPLLTTTWDQGQYYNAMCPEDENGQHCVTGCVATAMAQIINYWKYPLHGRGQHSYQTFQNEYGTLSVNFDESNYDYDNMPDKLTNESTQEEVNAVAKLIYDCGIANVLWYGSGGSSGYPGCPRTAFINHFGYSSNLGFADKHMYAPSEWIALLKSEIRDSAPVYCEGHDEIVGHAFVFDGYNSDDFFHVNFGWSGLCDGWFIVSAINVQFYTWGDWQTVLIGVRPNSTDNVRLCHTGSNPNSMNQEFYMVSEPIMLYNLSGKNEYLMNYFDQGGPIIMHFTPSDNLAQLVLDVLRFDEDCSVAVYDGNDMDSLICVYETRNTPASYDFLPSDTLLQQKATTDLSPIVSTKHGLTVVAYSYGMIDKEFHLRVSETSECRMVSNIEATPNGTGYNLTWNENGLATQWQVAWDDNIITCETTSVGINDLSHEAMHEVKIRSVCGNESYGEWESIYINNKKYWSDYVEEEPEGYTIVDDKLFISSAEGLTWLYRKCENLIFPEAENSRTVVIDADIDLGAHIWKPFTYYGKIIGQGHTISNIHTDFHIGDCGFLGHFEGDTISDLHIYNASINGSSSLGGLAGSVQQSVVINCSSTNYVVNNRWSSVGGLIGSADRSKIINSYSIGENYSGQLNGGFVGINHHTELINCYSSQGSSYNWCGTFERPNGLITGLVDGGIYDNCFADFENIDLHWDPEYDSIAKLYRFCGSVNSVNSIQNMAAFRVQGDTIGIILQDTAINYSLGDVDLLTALNNKVIEYNSSNLRTWVWDSESHLPTFGNYYEPACPNVSELNAKNIEIDEGFAVAVSWRENGDAEEWQVRCVDEDNNAVIYSAHSTNDTVTGLTLGKDYTIYVRPICGGEDTVGWGEFVNLYYDKPYWSDIVTELPSGYVVDDDGNITISTIEGLAWLNRMNIWNCFEGKTINIVNDLDMGAYRWRPMECFWGTIEGNSHTILNLLCRESLSYEDAQNIGFIGTGNRTTVRNLTIKNGIFTGRVDVGGFFGSAFISSFENCHIENATIIGRSAVGGFGGEIPSTGGDECSVINCSATGVIYADNSVGGLIAVVSAEGRITNSFSNCNIYSLGKGSLSTRGGLAGFNGGHFTNCYSAGVVEFDSSVYYNLTGTVFGDMNNPIPPEAQFVYALHSDDIPLLGMSEPWWIHYPLVLTDTASFDNSSTLQTPITIGENTYTDILAVLNAWVDANDTAGVYRHWAADVNGENGGFPVFAPIPCTPATGSDSVVVCDSYTLNGVTYTNSGTVYDTLVASDGCDSIVTIQLTVNRSTSSIFTVRACDEYTWHRYTYTESTDEPTYTMLGSNECDSVVNLHLTINHSSSGVETVTACNSYVWHDREYSESTDTATFYMANGNAVGCDSTVTLNLTINHCSTTTLTVCDSYTWTSGTGLTYYESGEYVSGEDTLVLTVNHPVHRATMESACDGYSWNGTDYTVSGDYTYSHEDGNGCTQVDTLHLTINQSVHTSATETECDTYSWNGTTFNASGDYTYSHADANGCMQVDTLHLTINHSAETSVNETAENSYTWNGTTYTESGTYSWVGTTAEGCDSTVTLHLTVETSQEGIDEADATAARVYVVGSRIVVDGAEGNPVYLYNAIGQLIKSQRKEVDGVMVIEAPAAGVYMVKVGVYPARKVVVIR